MNNLTLPFIVSLSSRIHSLNHFPKNHTSCYVKREDELGCGINGTKLRKYASLIPHFKMQQIQHLIIIAGPQSNNLLAALQVSRELGLKVTAFLIKPWQIEIKGNFKLSRLFLEEKSIIWVKREEWGRVHELACQYASTCQEKTMVLNEGASVPEAMEGAKSLANDIVRNESEHDVVFDHVLIDAGTGFSAAGLIWGLAEQQHAAAVHVLLLADKEEKFREKLRQWTGRSFSNVHCFCPTTAKSFGSINQAIRNEIAKIAKEEGILTDPIYSAKLFYESRRYIDRSTLRGNVLMIHSGGILTLSGCY